MKYVNLYLSQGLYDAVYHPEYVVLLVYHLALITCRRICTVPYIIYLFINPKGVYHPDVSIVYI